VDKADYPFHIVLIEPEIPPNTGNIARTCAATGCALHLVGPMGFKIDDAKLKRAGLDYWHLLPIFMYDSTEEFFARNKGEFYYFSTKGARRHSDVDYPAGAYLVFGPETRGLPEEMLAANYDHTLRIPMVGGARSLNLSNSVAVALYEAMRKFDYPGLETVGHLRENN